MTGVELIAEGERLARPCKYLRAGGEGRVAAVWGGPGVGRPPEGDFRHWLSIDVDFLTPESGLAAGCVGVYLNEADCKSGVVVHEPRAKLIVDTACTPLFAQPGISLPPLDAIFRFGSDRVRSWLVANDWDPSWGYNDNFRDQKSVDAYERRFQAECPLFAGGAHAMIGGWHLPWPEDDWEELLPRKLVVWTFEDAEPWVEVWRWDTGFRVIQRIT